MQEKDALPQTPQRRGAELISTSVALGDIVRQAYAHMMDFYVREQVGSSVAQTRRQVRGLGGQRRCMANGAADGAKEPAAISDRGCSSRRGSGGCGLVQELHEDSEQRGVTGDGGGAGTIGVRDVLGVADQSEVQAVGWKPSSKMVLTRQRPILRKQFVADVIEGTADPHLVKNCLGRAIGQ